MYVCRNCPNQTDCTNTDAYPYEGYRYNEKTLITQKCPRRLSCPAKRNTCQEGYRAASLGCIKCDSGWGRSKDPFLCVRCPQGAILLLSQFLNIGFTAAVLAWSLRGARKSVVDGKSMASSITKIGMSYGTLIYVV